MLTLLTIVYACGLLTILLVAHLKGQRINFAHIILSIFLSVFIFSLISMQLSLYTARGSHTVTKIPNKSDTSYIVRYDYKEDKYFVMVEDLFDISRAYYRHYLDSDMVKAYVDHVNDFTKYIEESVLNDH